MTYRRHPASYLLFCFLLPFLLLLTVYAIMMTFPFGKSSVLVLDLNGQYVYFFEGLRDIVLGRGSILYSFSRALGGEFLGMYAYYLASPLSYLVVLFPKKMILEALFLMILIKCGLCGLNFGIYLRGSTKTSRLGTVLCSTAYALSAYMVVMQHNIMWIDNVFLLPLIALGLQRLVYKKKYKLYTFSLILAIMSNFYIGYMTCIFSVLYFFYAYLSVPRTVCNPRGERAHFLRAGGRFAFFSAVAGAIGSLIFLPAAYSLTFGKSTFSSPSYDFVQKLDLFDILTKFYFGSYDTVRPEGLPFLYCGTLTLFLLPFYFLSRKIRTREKAASAFFILIFLFSFSNKLVDLVWHGFQAPNWLNFRYSFMLDFLLLVMAAKVIDRVCRRRPRQFVLIGSLLLLFLLIAETYDLKPLESMFFPVYTAAIALCTFTVLLSLLSHKKVRLRQARSLLLFFTSLELLLAGLLNTIQLDIDVVISSRDSYLNYEERWEEAFATAEEQETLPFYRMEKLQSRRVNDPFLFGYRGLSGSTSTLNRETIRFLDEMGLYSVSHASIYTGTTPFIDSFLSLRYVGGEQTDRFPSSYEKIYDNGDVVMYRNPNALPIAFGVNAAVNDITLHAYEYLPNGTRKDPNDTRTVCNYESPLERANALASALLGEKVELYRPLTHSYSSENVNWAVAASRYTPKDASREAKVTFSVTGVAGGEDIYAYFPTGSYESNSSCYLNGTYVGHYFAREVIGVLSFGAVAEGEKAEVAFTVPKDGIHIQRRDSFGQIAYFYALDSAVYERVMSTLSQSGYQVETCTEDRFTGRITVHPGQETVLTTIPYDEGWIIEADGVAIEGYKTLDALLAFDLPAGEHTLTLRYMPRIYRTALFLFLGGVAVLGAVLIADTRILRKRKKTLASVAGKDVSPCSITSKEN